MHLNHPQLVNTASTTLQMQQQLAALPPSLDPLLIVTDTAGKLMGWCDAAAFSSRSQASLPYQNEWQKIALGSLLQLQYLQTIVLVDADLHLLGIRSKEAPKVLALQGIIMAGGEGERLQPLTARLPKPLLEIKGKSLLTHAMEKLYTAGVVSLSFCLHHAAAHVEQHIVDHLPAGLSADIILEQSPMGTIGGIKLSRCLADDLLVVNTDVLSAVSLQEMYHEFSASKADMMVLAVKYRQTLPYAKLKMQEGKLTEIREKPSETMQINGGIYFIKRHVLSHIPEGVCHATQLIDILIMKGLHVRCFETEAYWQDIGTPEDLNAAQNRLSDL